MKIDVMDPLRVLVTAHDGDRCLCRIAVTGFPMHEPPIHAHVALTWGAVAMLSSESSREFAQALICACDIADQMARNGGFDE